MVISQLTTEDIAWALPLNNQAVPAVNALDEAALANLLDMSAGSWFAGIDGEPCGLLVSLGPGTGYASENYRWLETAFDEFRYVDRIVVSPAHHRKGIAAALYDELELNARRAQVPRLVCEVNVDPPNPGSIAFHTGRGWTPVADLTHDGGKTVRFFERPL